MYYDVEIIHVSGALPPIHLESVQGSDPFQAEGRAVQLAFPGATFVSQERPEWKEHEVKLRGILDTAQGSVAAMVVVKERVMVGRTRSEAHYRKNYSSAAVVDIEGLGLMVPRDAHALARAAQRRLHLQYTN